MTDPVAKSHNKDYHNKFIYYTVPEDSIIACTLIDNDSNKINGKCIDISLGGVGVVCDEYIPEGEELMIEIDLNRLTDGHFTKPCAFKTKVINHHDVKPEPFTALSFHLSRESLYDLRQVNNYLTSKIPLKEIYDILDQAGVTMDDLL